MMRLDALEEPSQNQVSHWLQDTRLGERRRERRTPDWVQIRIQTPSPALCFARIKTLLTLPLSFLLHPTKKMLKSHLN